ncbi:hypothetical protein KVT40_000599 [Elsinoe batatas]|uniref:DUF218 domain-containing protein n=1 Tax=Elsinoe batatas TaxID=2601811 RepID=A0A8K0L819_9PEZI|nr:hypothetical protein KVT40_000599 [Elsinoe batatas]
MSSPDSVRLAEDINLLAGYLAESEVHDLAAHNPVDCIVICASQVLAQPDVLFRALESNPTLTKTVVVAGGIGHSTQAIYDAVATHPVYHVLAEQVSGLPEALVLGLVLKHFFDLEKIESQGCRVLYETLSTNCGANASEVRRVLEIAHVSTPQSYIIVQDPTMLRRTIASFNKVYDDVDQPPRFAGCPIFVPIVVPAGKGISYSGLPLPSNQLWPLQRYKELLAGEIPRLRDDNEVYGPLGKGFIAHVDIPEDVQVAGVRLRRHVGYLR